jgi:hypothetical protein
MPLTETNLWRLMTMKKLLPVLLILGFIMISCGNNNGTEDESNEDYIDITSVEPAIVAEGEEVSFTIGCDVRLASETGGSIFIGFNNTDNPDKYIVKQVAVIAEPYEGSLTFNLSDFDLLTKPVFREAPESYNIYINLSPFIQTTYETWTPLSIDTWPITVNKGVSEINDYPSGFFAECDFLECSGHSNNVSE